MLPDMECPPSIPSAVSVLRVSDALWANLAPLIATADPPAVRGRHRCDNRAVLDAILYRLISGCAWHQLPPAFPYSSSVYRTYQRWQQCGLLPTLLTHILHTSRQPPAGAGARRGAAGPSRL